MIQLHEKTGSNVKVKALDPVHFIHPAPFTGSVLRPLRRTQGRLGERHLKTAQVEIGQWKFYGILTESLTWRANKRSFGRFGAY